MDSTETYQKPIKRNGRPPGSGTVNPTADYLLRRNEGRFLAAMIEAAIAGDAEARSYVLATLAKREANGRG